MLLFLTQTSKQLVQENYILNGAKVGDAAQFTSYVEADYRFGKFNVDLGYRFVDGLYADYSIADSAFTAAK